MTEFLVDRTGKGKPHRRIVHVCHHCDHAKYPYGRPIVDDDAGAQLVGKGDWMCSTCVSETLLKLMKRPDHD